MKTTKPEVQADPKPQQQAPNGARETQHRQTRRAHFHDYKEPGYYMFTGVTTPGSPRLSEVAGDPRLKTGPDSPHIVHNPAGSIVRDCIDLLDKKYPDLFKIHKLVVMPDHYHLLLQVKTQLPQSVTHFLGRVHSGCTGGCRRAGLIGPTQSLFGTDAINDRILYAKGQLNRMFEYINDNPRRYLFRRRHPDLFTVKRNVQIDSTLYDVKGNIFLLKKPELMVVHVRRKWTDRERQEYAAKCRRAVARGAVLVSPFISPHETAIMNEALDAGGEVIKVEYEGFAERQNPTGRWHDLCAEGRVLFIAEAGSAASREHIRRQDCVHLNDLAEQLASYAMEADSGSKTKGDSESKTKGHEYLLIGAPK